MRCRSMSTCVAAGHSERRSASLVENLMRVADETVSHGEISLPHEPSILESNPNPEPLRFVASTISSFLLCSPSVSLAYIRE
jgi:hypothetical protein